MSGRRRSGVPVAVLVERYRRDADPFVRVGLVLTAAKAEIRKLSTDRRGRHAA